MGAGEPAPSSASLLGSNWSGGVGFDLFSLYLSCGVFCRSRFFFDLFLNFFWLLGLVGKVKDV